MRLILLLVLSGAVSTNALSNLRRAADLDASVSGTPLPPAEQAKLREVEQGVQSLEAPSQTRRKPVTTVAPVSSATADCSLLGGLTSAKISSQCCANAQVVTQRQLAQYGVARPCKADWQCEVDGKTPSPVFEKQSLSSMCGEPNCLPLVVDAFKRNPLTAEGADEMQGICTTLSSIGGNNASAEAVSKILMGRPRTASSKKRKECQRLYCKDTTAKEEFCAKDEDQDNCRQYCCPDKETSACFPGEALVRVETRGEVPMAKLRTGDKVLVKSQGQLSFEPVLSFLHVIRKQAMPFVVVKHLHGEFRASASHIVFTSEDSEGLTWTSKLVGDLQAGDRIFTTAVQGGITPSLVLAAHHSTTSVGMYAPLTYSGTIVVDGVLASNYASSSEQKHLSHNLAHMFLFPVRLYHHIGFASMLQPAWQWLCSPAGNTKSLCQGGDAAEESIEEMHPYLRVAWKTLNLDMLLSH